MRTLFYTTVILHETFKRRTFINTSTILQEGLFKHTVDLYNKWSCSVFYNAAPRVRGIKLES